MMGEFVIGPRESEISSAGGQVVYYQTWTRRINGVRFDFDYVIQGGETALVWVYRDGALIHELAGPVREMPGLVTLSRDLGAFFGL